MARSKIREIAPKYETRSAEDPRVEATVES